MTEDQRQLAIKRIRAKQGFWIHLAIYLAVNTMLVIIWAATSSDQFWPMWPMLGWGIGVVAHGLGLRFGPSTISEERIIREMENHLADGR